MNTALINNLISLMLVGISGLRNLGIDYQKVIERQAQRRAEGGTLTAKDRAEFVEASAQKIGRL